MFPFPTPFRRTGRPQRVAEMPGWLRTAMNARPGVQIRRNTPDT